MPILLDLLRHGFAAPSGDGGDSRRPLTAEGERAIEGLAATLAMEPERPDRVFASPLLRAQQTAHLVVRGLGLAAPIEELAELEPDRDPTEVLEALAAFGIGSGHVLLVGHQPQMGRLVSSLTGATHVRVAPGTLVRIRFLAAPAHDAGRIVFVRDAGR